VKQEIVNFDYSNYNKVPSLAILKQARIDHKKEIWGKGLLSIDNPLNLKCNEITLLFDARVKDDLLYCKLCEQIVTDIKLCKIDRSIVMSRDNAMFACDECIRHQSSMIKELKTVSTQSIEPIIDQHIKLNDSDVKSLLLYQKHLCSICFIDLKKKKNKSGINMFVIEFIPYLSSRSINQHICCSTCYNALIIKNREFAIKGTRGAYNEKILLVSLAKQFAPLYRKYAINEVGNEEARALGLIRKHTISETIYDNGEKTIDSIICGRCYSFISTDFIHKDNLYNIIYVDIKSNYKYVLICQYCKMNKSKQYYGKSVKIDYIKKVNNMLTQ
jgi:hypothetical protein